MGTASNSNKLWHVCGVTLYTWVHQQYNNSTIVLATIFKAIFWFQIWCSKYSAHLTVWTSFIAQKIDLLCLLS